MRLLKKLILFLRSRRSSKARQWAERWESSASEWTDKETRRNKQLRRLQSRLESVGRSLSEDSDEFEQLLKRHSEAMEALRAENEVLKMQVDALVHFHQELVERAKSAEVGHVFRQVASERDVSMTGGVE